MMILSSLLFSVLHTTFIRPLILLRELVDTHCHLCDDAFNKDLDQVVKRAVEQNVRASIVATEEVVEFEKAIKIKEKYPNFINLCFGIHPVQKRIECPGQLRGVNLKDMKNAPELIIKYSKYLVGIGEVGLDFTPTYCPTATDQEIQKSILVTHIKLAKDLDLPLNVHSRSAGKPTIEFLKSNGVTRAQLHAFDGRPSQAMEGVKEGYFFSVPPCVLRSKQKQEIVKTVPLDHLLLETDSPLLGVTGKERNEPGEVVKVCNLIAKIKNTDYDTVAQITTENAIKLYRHLNFEK